MPERSPILEMKGINKYFPGVQALSNVDFSLYKGEVHAIMGQNGAGKSTLIKILTGVHKQDSGDILLGGRSIRPKSPLDAQRSGISTVYQEVNLCLNLTVAENIFIGRQPRKFGKIDWQRINRQAEELLFRKMNLKIDVTRELASYSVAIQQMVAIVRVLEMSAKILILDEPTSSLDENEVELLFKVIRKLRDDGLAIIFITHFLEQTYQIADRITILKNGELVGVHRTADLPRIELIAKMLGKELSEFSFSRNKECKEDAERTSKTADELLNIKALGRHGSIQPFDLKVKKGEVLGLAGLLGSGRTEMARLIFGIDKADQGEIQIMGHKVNINAPNNAIAFEIGFCPEDRKEEGIVADLSVRENIILALQGRNGVFKHIPVKKQNEIVESLINSLGIKTPSAEQEVRKLSGGNQQKVMLARWLAIQPQILILDEPTRGIDVGAKEEIMELVLNLSKEGMAVIFISSEFEEVVRCSNRIAILRDKAKIGELSGAEIDEQSIMRTIAGGKVG
ncbi:MAG TPA: sugar ABC transporter ATP-binding protein [Firmicutes bacterium]|jgi:galactofuranose transport system ATP-binding protein|nr:sugar ABC transporter ATP-binding protein [Bacillota bacterium]